jgi:hypothetical protein
MRALVAALLLIGGAAQAKALCTDGLCYTDRGGPTGYDHAILGSIPEWREVTFGSDSFSFETGFIEDTAPRMADVNGDGATEALVVHSRPNLGARLVVLSLPDLREMAATPHIGTHHRWLAVIGAGDFDGDGRVEIAYVDRPHLAQQLVFVRMDGARLIEVERRGGLTNHRIGDETIRSAVRACAGDVLLMSGDWQRMMAAKIGAPARDLGPYSPPAWDAALDCAE